MKKFLGSIILETREDIEMVEDYYLKITGEHFAGFVNYKSKGLTLPTVILFHEDLEWGYLISHQPVISPYKTFEEMANHPEYDKYSKWFDNSAPLDVLVNQNDYPEYFL